MSLTNELLPAQEQQIQEEAGRAGVSVAEIIQPTLEARFPTATGITNRETLELLARWEREDALASDQERAEDARIFEQLHANMNETRRSIGMRTL